MRALPTFFSAPPRQPCLRFLRRYLDVKQHSFEQRKNAEIKACGRYWAGLVIGINRVLTGGSALLLLLLLLLLRGQGHMGGVDHKAKDCANFLGGGSSSS